MDFEKGKHVSYKVGFIDAIRLFGIKFYDFITIQET